MMKVWTGGWCLLIALYAAGCGSGGPELGTVSGRVTLDGKPLPNALITFVPEGGGRAATGTSDANGHYRLIYINRDGALVGKHRVSIAIVPPAAQVTEVRSDSPEYQKQAAQAAYDYTAANPQISLPARYGPDSELIYEVKSGENVIDLELKST